MKTCTKCREWKPMSEFYAQRYQGRESVHSRCKECMKNARRKPRTCASCSATYFRVGSAGSLKKVCDDCAANVKHCPICETVKPHADFYRSGVYCKPCASSYNRSSRYGIPRGEYERMYAEQGGRCAACGTERPTLCVDHDHGSGKVRGLLCDGCNKGIGCLGESVEAMTGAVAYLLQHTDVLGELSAGDSG